MRAIKNVSVALIIVAVVGLAFVAVVPHTHATDEAAAHCSFCIAHRSPALAVVDIPPQPTATLIGYLAIPDLHGNQIAAVSAAAARAPPLLL